jgi:hypothetical protein
MQENKTILVTQFYIPDDVERYQELKYCVRENISNGLIDQIVLVVEKGTLDRLIPSHKKIKIVFIEKRPSYGDLFEIATSNINGKGLIIIANSDIFYKEDDILKMKIISDKQVFALSRWDFKPDSEPKHHDTWDSQDTWVFRDNILPGEYDIKLGLPGCDNKIAYELQKAGHEIKNPSKTIKSYHYHTSNHRSYKEEDRVKEPYLFINTEE